MTWLYTRTRHSGYGGIWDWWSIRRCEEAWPPSPGWKSEATVAFVVVVAGGGGLDQIAAEHCMVELRLHTEHVVATVSKLEREICVAAYGDLQDTRCAASQQA